MAFPFQRGGLRGNPNTDLLYLKCLKSGNTYLISSAQTFDEWNVAYRHVPRSFCSGDVILVGTSNAASAESYLGVATPFKVSRATFLAHTDIGARAAVLILAWTAFVLIGLASAILLSLHSLDALPSAIIGIGVSGVIVFATGLLNFHLSSYAAITLVAISALTLLSNRRRRIWSELRMPMLLWLAIGMVAFLFVAGIDNGGGRWAANAMFSPLSWSVDNQNPVLFAYRFAHATKGEALVAGPWYFDDRTPLLTVLMIVPQTLFIEPLSRLVGTDFIYTADSAIGVLLLALWAPVLLWFSFRAKVRHRMLFIAIVAISPFMLFNTVYTWGKMLGAAYILLAVGLTLLPERRNLGLIPTALVLCYLSHSGNAIAGAAFLIVFANALRWGDVKTLTYGAFVALVVMAPWVYWIKVVQPFGNALVRYQLANDTGFDHRSSSILASVLQCWKGLGLEEWLAMKLHSFHMLVDVPLSIGFGGALDNRTSSFAENQRAGDFVVLARTIGIASVGAILAIFRGSAFQKKLILCGVVGVVSMTLLIVRHGYVPHQAYGSIVLIAAAGAMYLADQHSRIPTILFGTWLAYFAAVWIVSPIVNADHLHFGALIMAVLWLCGAVIIVASSSRALPAWRSAGLDIQNRAG
ncbi:hypothetical protein DVT68_01240 [Dyella solisilvae]|uniref:Uncharacterized protein n=2 Tax=Dyella solisilvae TaxID=1920168 RepID=A0A370KA48_9GAMM|nr:hypothetical protein DVT68_01240 [Dyella solisilvae]